MSEQEKIECYLLQRDFQDKNYKRKIQGSNLKEINFFWKIEQKALEYLIKTMLIIEPSTQQ